MSRIMQPPKEKSKFEVSREKFKAEVPPKEKSKAEPAREKSKSELHKVVIQPAKEDSKVPLSGYTALCTSLLDTSRQVLLDGKALVEMIHNPQDDIDEKVMVQVRKSIEISEKLASVANALNQEFNVLFSSAPRTISEKFHLHEQIFLNSTNTVQNSMVTLTRLTKSIISNIYMQTGISISQDKVDSCCKNLATALKSMISAMETIRKMADDLSSKLPSSPRTNGSQSPLAKDEEIPALDHGVVLDTACKAVRDWVQKLVNLVLKGDEGGDRSDLEYAKNFYDVGRSTMNHMVKLINFSKRIGMLDEEARLKLLLFQLLSLAKSFNSNSQLTGALPDKQIQELNLVRVQIEESLWWFVKMAKLRCSYIPVPTKDQPLDSTTSHPILALPPKPLPPLPASKSAPGLSSPSSPSLSHSLPSSPSPSSSLSSSPSSSPLSSSSSPAYSAPTTLTRSTSNPPNRFITPTSSAAKFEQSVTKLMIEEEESPADSVQTEENASTMPRAPKELPPKPRSSPNPPRRDVTEQPPLGEPAHKQEQEEMFPQYATSPQVMIHDAAPNSPTTEARLKSVLQVTNAAPLLSRSMSLAAVKAPDNAKPVATNVLSDDPKNRRKVLEIPPEVLHGIILPPHTQSALDPKKRPVSQQILRSDQKWVEQRPFDLKSTGKSNAKVSTLPRKMTYTQVKLAAEKLAEAENSADADTEKVVATEKVAEAEKAEKVAEAEAENLSDDDKPPEIPPKPPGLKMSINVSQDRESVSANVTLRKGVLRRAHPQSVIFDTKKQHSTMGAYKGDLDLQMMNFRAKITAHLDYILLDTYALNADDMHMLMNEKDAKVNSFWSTLQNPPPSEKKKDKKGDQMRKNPNIKIRPFDDLGQIFSKTELEASAELARRLETIVHTTFDQYEGLRQINDFRSVPDVGQTILQVSNVTNTQLKKQLVAGSILIVCNFLQQVLANKEIVKMYLPATKDEFLDISRHEHNLKLATDNILLEYCKLKAGLLLEIGYVSSIVEQENGFNLNHAIVDKFLTEIYEITENCINSQVELFAKRASEVEKIPKKRQKVIFAKFGGKEAFGQLATNTLALLRPWMRKWVDVQVPSIVQRELFAKDIESLKLALEESKNNMVTSFQELLNNQVPEPLYKFDAILKSIDEELELATAIFGI